MDTKKLRNYLFNFILFLLFIVFISCGGNPEKDFEKASNQNTIEAYQKFIEKYPSEIQSDKAKAILTEIKNLSVPLPNLYLGKSKLINDINLLKSFRVTYYLYGGSKTLTWSYKIKNEIFNDTLYYNITLGSAGKSNVIFKFILFQDKKETELGKSQFIVDSKYYKPYSGKISPKHIDSSGTNRTIIFKMIGSGSNFGVVHNINSFIKVFKSTKPIPEEILIKISNIFLWLSRNSKWGTDSDLFTQFRNQINRAVLDNFDAEWKFGWNLFKSEKAYIILWKNKMFDITEKSVEEAKKMGLKKSQAKFSVIK